jgi:Flp pilus assembly pilin Flp
MKTLQNRKKIRGQGMTEYIIIVALVAVAAIGVYSFFGETIRNQMSGISSEVVGTSATTAIGNAKTSAAASVTAARKDKGLNNYNEDNKVGVAGTN